MTRAVSIPQIASFDVTDITSAARAVREQGEAIRKLQARGTWQTLRADLVVGRNAVAHSLGRAPAFVAVMPTVADATFAWRALITQPDNPHPDRQVLIDVVGVAQPGAALLVM